MYNKEVYEELDTNCFDAQINKLFWIAVSVDSSDLRSILMRDISENDWKNLFPDIEWSDFEDDMISNLIEGNQLGFFAEVYVPTPREIVFGKDDTTKPIGWTHSRSSNMIAYIYSETIEGLLEQMKIAAEKIFQECIQSELRRLESIRN